jgi:hypothetical protein
MATTRRDAFLQLDELEAPLPLGLTGWRGLALVAGLHGLVGLARFHDGTSFRINSSLRYHEVVIARRSVCAPAGAPAVAGARAGAGLAWRSGRLSLDRELTVPLHSCGRPGSHHLLTGYSIHHFLHLPPASVGPVGVGAGQKNVAPFAMATTRRDAFLQLDELEAALPLWLTW